MPNNTLTSTTASTPLYIDQKYCCILDCIRSASIRNYSCLRGSWKLKQEFESAFVKGVILKICTCHYNEDLRNNPRPEKQQDKNKAAAAVTVDNGKKRISARVSKPKKVVASSTHGSKTILAIKMNKRFQNVHDGAADVFYENGMDMSCSSGDDAINPQTLYFNGAALNKAPTDAMEDANDNDEHFDRDSNAHLDPLTTASTTTTPLLLPFPSSILAKRGTQPTLAQQKMDKQQARAKQAKTRTESLNAFYKRQSQKLLQNPQIQALLSYHEGSIPKRGVASVSVMYNLSNDPCLKYSLSYLVELFREENNLLKNKVLYLETQTTRYEFSMQGDTDAYRLSSVNVPQQISVSEMEKMQIPLSAEHVQDVFCDIRWNEVEWGVSGVKIRNQTFPFVKMLVWKRTAE